MLKRLKTMGASQNVLLDVYTKQLRSVLEFASVVWHSGLTKEDSIQIERVQKCALAVTLGMEYRSYEDACDLLQIQYLNERRTQLSYNFALKSSNHPIHRQWFELNEQASRTRSEKNKFKPTHARTARLMKSAIPI